MQLAIALSLRTVAWPEVTTPGYLWSRGWLLYRNIKFQHTPATMGTLALGFAAFGPKTWFLRAYATVWPLIAHVSLLKDTRRARTGIRALASAFFLVFLFGFEGNAIWPTVVMTALAIPIAAALSRKQMARAGLLIGIAILFKQTAAFVLFLATLALVARRRWREAIRLFLAGSFPYVLTVAIFAAFGAGLDILRWTILVPLTVRPANVNMFYPGFSKVLDLVLAFTPLAIEAILERPGERTISAQWLLLVAAGLAAIVYPDFTLFNAVACVPCLAVGAARLMERRPRWLSRVAIAFVATLTLSRGAMVVAGADFDGRVLFWNDEPAFNALIDRLRRLPPDTRVYSSLWGNVNPRAERLPPGDVYVHPWFDWFSRVDDTGERIRRANARPGVVIVGMRGASPSAEAVGPYSIEHR
ncbi:MAG TPA: hypothetical protein VMN82_08465 [Thermoanaerobaculia bacterium]|nr:hypothetical protein [Thermoanaerobaculia bacterium]